MEAAKVLRWLGILLGILFGIATHGFFALTAYRLFFYLQDTRYQAVEGGIGINFLLALQFTIPHSLLLHPAVRKRLDSIVPAPFYGCFYTNMICLNLWVTFLFWRQSTVMIWQLQGVSRTLVEAGYYASWIALFYSVSLTGFGWQTGFTPWIHWVRGLPVPPRRFEPKGAYRFLRHPVYLSFLGLIWFTPDMSLDHAQMTLIWTAYIFVGSYLKDERLAYYAGESYRRYQTEVYGYPGIPVGPLGKRRVISRGLEETTNLKSEI